MPTGRRDHAGGNLGDYGAPWHLPDLGGERAAREVNGTLGGGGEKQIPREIRPLLDRDIVSGSQGLDVGYFALNLRHDRNGKGLGAVHFAVVDPFNLADGVNRIRVIVRTVKGHETLE